MQLDKIHHLDCVEGMRQLPDKSIDLVMTDPPYGTTDCAWDTEINLEELWEQIKRVLRPEGMVVFTASQPFTSRLVMSNPSWFKCEWIWEKNAGSNFGTVKWYPMKEHENIIVFCKGTPKYNPQMEERKGAGKERVQYDQRYATKAEVYQKGTLDGEMVVRRPEMRVPSSVQKFNRERGLHPTQKPLGLFSYLIKTYSDEGCVVLDPFIGSGTTAVACQQTGRKFIGFEISKEYVEIAKKRLAQRSLNDTEVSEAEALRTPPTSEDAGIRTEDTL